MPGFDENGAFSLPGFYVTVLEAQSLLLIMSWPQFCEQEILLKCCLGLNHLEKTLAGKVVNCDSSPTRMWKHHKPHCATINNTTLSHYSEFHWGVLDGNNGVCVRDCGCLLLLVPGRTWENVGCSPSVCVWTPYCFPPPNSNAGNKKSADGTGDKKNKGYITYKISPAINNWWKCSGCPTRNYSICEKVVKL